MAQLMIRKQVQLSDGVVGEGLFFDRVPNSHVRLFRREVMDLMTENEFLYLVSRYIQPQMHDKLIDLWHGGGKNRELAKYRLFSTVSLFEQPGSIDYFLDILQRASPLVQQQMNLEGLRTHQYYANFFIGTDSYKMDRIASTLEPEKVADQLKRGNCRHYEDMLARVDAYLHNGKVDDAACEMIRSLPYCTDSIYSIAKEGEWYYDFMNACLMHGSTAILPRFINPEFEHELVEFKTQKDQEARKSLQYETNLVETDEVIDAPRPQSNYAAQRELSFEYSYEPAEYMLRPYQNELVAHANRGRNTIICAPTGSGKTLVATDIILKHLRGAKMEGRIARVVMLVPTIPLVEQQTIEFLRYMTGEFWVDGFSGAENHKSRGYAMLAADVVVCTPQILINMLNSILQEERVYFVDFTMMIFDECHNCTENHPYRVLMEMLERCEMPTPKPQIIGLTASLGVGQSSWDINACREHMLKMCSYLMADSISTVRHQLDNLRAHVVPPVDVVVKCKRPLYDEFLDAINKAMATIENNMRPVLKAIVEKKSIPLSEEDITFPRRDHPDKYQSVVGALRRSLERLQDPKNRLFLIRSIDHLAHYFHAIAISDLLPSKYALDYLDSKMCAYIRSNNPEDVTNQFVDLYSSTRKELVKRAKDEQVANKEILQKLYHILSNQYTAKPDSRTLIFVSTRVCAKQLSEHLSKYLSTLKSLPPFYNRPEYVAGYMTSSNQSTIAGGQSSKMQRLMRARFESGELKILVVTSVADEGINIVECNLIVKYNNVGSERALIQRRGRARARDSKSILLALDSGVEAQEFLNMQKEAMMMRCIEDLQAQSDTALQMMIAKKTARIRADKDEELRKLRVRRELLSMRKYSLKCRACGVKICDSMDIRSIADCYFVCVDPEVWTRSANDFIRRPTADGITTKCARWLCLKCDEEWGQVVKFSNVYLPAVNTRSFVLERLDTNEPVASVSNKKTWVQIQNEFFNVDAITAKNIRDMHHALMSLSEFDYKQMEKQEQLANRLVLEKLQERKDARALRHNDLLDE